MSKSEQTTQDGTALERGRFSDGRTVFTVRASSLDAPDSLQVYAGGNPADIVLIVSGINSGNLRATWGDDWRSADDEWKQRFKDQTFIVFYDVQAPAIEGARFCDG